MDSKPYSGDQYPISHAYEAITVSSTAIGFTAATLTASTVKAVCTLETASIRFTTDGTTPTAAVGHLANAGDVIVIEGREDVVNFKAIRTGSDASLRVTYKRA